MAKGMESAQPSDAYEFGAYRLDVVHGTLSCGNRQVRLRPKSLEVLVYLLEHPKQLVTKDELIAAVWAPRIVTDGSLTQCVKDIRRALGSEGQQLIHTSPKRGYVLEAHVEKGRSQNEHSAGRVEQRRGGRWRVWATVGVAVALAISLAFSLLLENRPSLPGEHEPRIAVLPFGDLSPTADQQYLADGLAEDILNRLTEVPGLRVLARRSSFTPGVDTTTLATKAGVDYVLKGSWRRLDDRVRVTARLIEAASSEQLWSDAYDREFEDVLELQEDIAGAVARSLHVALAEREAGAVTPPYDVEAYEHFLKGRFFWHRRGPGDMQLARDHLERSIALDPRVAEAWTGLAGVYNALAVHGEVEWQAARAGEREAVTQALALAPDSPEAHARAWNHYWQTGNDALANRHRDMAEALGEDSWLVQGFLAGGALRQGRYDEAVDLQRQALLLDPLSPITQGNFAKFLVIAGRYDEAEAEFIKLSELSRTLEPLWLGQLRILQGSYREALSEALEWPDGASRDQVLSIAFHALGMHEKAAQALRRLELREQKQVDPQGISEGAPLMVAEVLAQTGDLERAFEQIEHSWAGAVSEDRTPQWTLTGALRKSAFLAPLRSDPRWEPLVNRIESFAEKSRSDHIES